MLDFVATGVECTYARSRCAGEDTLCVVGWSLHLCNVGFDFQSLHRRVRQVHASGEWYFYDFGVRRWHYAVLAELAG